MLREADRAWFSRLLQHPARKWRRSILTTPEPTRSTGMGRMFCGYVYGDRDELSVPVQLTKVCAVRGLMRAGSADTQ